MHDLVGRKVTVNLFSSYCEGEAIEVITYSADNRIVVVKTELGNLRVNARDVEIASSEGNHDNEEHELQHVIPNDHR